MSKRRYDPQGKEITDEKVANVMLDGLTEDTTNEPMTYKLFVKMMLHALEFHERGIRAEDIKK